MSRRTRAENRLAITLYGDHVDVLDAVALAEGRPASEVAAALLGGALDQAAQEQEIQELLDARRRRARRGRLHVVTGRWPRWIFGSRRRGPYSAGVGRRQGGGRRHRSGGQF